MANVHALLIEAQHEIKCLRALVSEMKPKAHAYDTLAAYIRLQPSKNEGAGLDIVWQIDKYFQDQPNIEGE